MERRVVGDPRINASSAAVLLNHLSNLGVEVDVVDLGEGEGVGEDLDLVFVGEIEADDDDPRRPDAAQPALFDPGAVADLDAEALGLLLQPNDDVSGVHARSS